jgi:hypothetical protein
MKKFFLGTSFFLAVSPVFAANHLFIAGGGGEPLKNGDGTPNTKTMFDMNLKAMAAFKMTTGYNTKISFNGGHAETEEIISKNFKPDEVASSTFDKKSYENTIKAYETKILNGEIKTGDQLLIYIDTHGAYKTSTEESHSIALGKSPLQNLQTLGSDMVSLDQLKSLTILAKDKGIKLGILDLSCHSGSTLALRNENTCIITSTGPEHYGFGGNSETFGSRFLNAFKKGKSLEDVYLEVRGNFQDSSFPMISSPAGIEVQNSLYPLIGRYLYYFDNESNKLKSHIDGSATKEEMCKDEESIRQINNIIEQISTLSQLSSMSLNPKKANDLRQNLKTYYNYQKAIKEALVASGKEKLSNREEFCEPYAEVKKDGKKNTKKACQSYTWEQLVKIDYDAINKYFTDSLKTKKGSDLAETKAFIEAIKKAKLRSLELKAQYPALKDLNQIYKKLDNKESETYNLAYKISTDLQSLYVDQYRLKSRSDARPNPCKDFKL